jgi:hypothetical protein
MNGLWTLKSRSGYRASTSCRPVSCTLVTKLTRIVLDGVRSSS